MTVRQSGVFFSTMVCDVCGDLILIELWQKDGVPMMNFKCQTCKTQWDETNTDAINKYPELTGD